MPTYPPTNSDVFTSRAEDGTPRRPATEAEIARIQIATQAVQQADFPKLFDPNANPDQKLFHVSFDGTWNDRDKQIIDTNPAELQRLIESAAGGESGKAIYKSGVGSQGGPGGVFDGGVNAGNAAKAIVDESYDNFIRQVRDWKVENPNADVVLSIAGFSRGGAEALDFANRVHELGVPDLDNPGQYLIPPGEVKLGPMLLYDPVDKTLGMLNVSVPPSATSVLVLGAADEYRSQFPAIRVTDPNNPDDPRITRLDLPGSHTDLGGGYDYGIGAYALQIGHDYLAQSGVPIAEIPSELAPGNAPLYVHDPSTDSYNNAKWDVYSSRIFDDHPNPTPDPEKIASLYPEGSKRIDPQTLEIKPVSHVSNDETASTDPTSTDNTNTHNTSEGEIEETDDIADTTDVLDDDINADQSDGTIVADADPYVPPEYIMTDAGPVQINGGGGIGGATPDTAPEIPDLPNGSDLASDQYSAVNSQLSGTTLDLTPEQQQGLMQHLNEFGLGGLNLVELPGGAVMVTDTEGNVIGSIERDGDGAVRYVNDSGDGIQIDSQGQSQPVTNGYSMEERQQWTQAQAAFGGIQSALSFIQALEQGNELSAVISGVAMVKQLLAAGGPLPAGLQEFAGTMGEIGAGLGMLSAGMNLADALESGDALAILQSGANLGAQGLQVYSILTDTQLFSPQGIPLNGLGEVAQNLGNVAAGLGFIMALQSGNPVSIASSSLSLLSTLGYIGPWGAVAAVVVSIFGSLFGSDAPMLEGQAGAVWDDSGALHVVTTQDAEGGGATATNWMQNLVDGLREQLAAARDASGQPLYDLIPQRLPSIGYQYDPDGFNLANGQQGHLYLKWADDNGHEQTRYYDGAGSRGDGSGENLVQDFMRQAAQAVVSAWEADTVRAHYLQDIAQAQAKEGQAAALEAQASNLGLPFDESGRPVSVLFDESGRPVAAHSAALEHYYDLLAQARQLKAEAQQLRAEANQVAAIPEPGAGLPQEAADGLTQHLTALTFDIAPPAAGGAGATDSHALIDIDGDGYLERTDWVASNQAMLAIDTNGDGRIMAGELLQVTPGSLARNSLNWLDANGDGMLSAGDPAFAALRLWIDANGDGQTQGASEASPAELQSLAAAGIAAIDFNVNPPRLVKADGSSIVLTEQHLTGDVKGVAYMMTGSGLLESMEAGETVLHAVNTQAFAGQAEHTHGGEEDADGSSEAVMIDKNNAKLVSTSANTVANTSRREDVVLAPGDNRVTAGAAGVTLAGQAGGQQTAAPITAGSNQVRSNGLAFVPLGAANAAQELRQVTEEMVRNADNSLFGLGVGNSVLTAVGIGIGATQWPTVASAEPISTSDASNPMTPVPHTQDTAFANTGTTAISAATGTSPASGPGFVLPVDQTRIDLDALIIGKIISNGRSDVSTWPVSVSMPSPAGLIGADNLSDVATSDARPVITSTVSQIAPAEISPNAAGNSAGAADVVLDYPTVAGEFISGIEDIGLRFPESMLLANDSTVNTAAFPDQPSLRITAVGSPSHGQVALRTRADGTTEVVFIPDLNYHGPASFTYTVTDQYGLSSTAVVDLMVEAVNDAPVTQNESAAGNEDNTLLFHAADLLANDRDVDSAVDGDVLRITRVGEAQHGQVFLDADGTIRFVPDANYNGPAQFTYWVGDRDTAGLISNGGEGYEIPATMYLTVIAVNDLPVVAGEQIDSDEDIVLTIDPALLLANDTDVDTATNGQVLSITAVGNAQHGTVELLTSGPDAGTIRFTPEQNYFGTASFSYTVDDGNGGLVTCTAVVNLAPVNDAPDVVGETVTFNEDTVQTIDQAALLANDSDVDNVHGDLRIIAVDNATHGTVLLNPDGSIRFAPDADYYGPASFTYTVSDGAGGFTVGTASLDILPVNDAPRLHGEAVAVDEDQVLHFSITSLLDNDIDVDNLHDDLRITGVSNASNGAVRLENGEIIFTPDLNFNGQASFTYTVDDGVGGQSQATVNITLNPVNDAPVVNNDLLWGKRNVTYTLTQAALLSNDTDVEHPNGLSIVGIENVQHGTATLHANGSVTFIPEAGYVGRGQFDYIVRDPDGATRVGTAEIDFSRVNVNPIAVNDSFVGFEDTAFVISAAQLTVNDVDPDPTLNSSLTVSAVANAVNGSVSLQPDGSVRFVPNANFYGTATFQYLVNDGEGGSTWATAHLNVQSVNDAPVIEDIWYGRPIYGYQWVRTTDEYNESGWGLAPVTDESTALALLANPNDMITTGPYWWSPSRRNDLMDANGNAIGGNYYQNGHLRPIAFSYADALGKDEMGESGPLVDDLFRQNGKVIAYDPDGNSNALTFSIASSAQHGHVWVNQYMDSTAPDGLDHTQTGGYWRGETGAWQYYSHRGDPYFGSDPFAIRVTDSGGASTNATISTSHRGSSAGGGGGCPVVLDLDGDGIELVRPEDSTLFADINGDGWRERMGWAAASDGVLAYDVDHDGRIRRTDEVSFVGYKEGARTDMEGLVAFDTDGDGKLTANDREWKSFGIVQDINDNGIHEQGEFISLDKMGISSIGLERRGTPHLNNGNVVFGISDVQFTNGSTTVAADVMFAGENVPLPDEVQAILAASQSSSVAAAASEQSALQSQAIASTQTGAITDVGKETVSPDLAAAPASQDANADGGDDDAALAELAYVRQMALVFNQAAATMDAQSDTSLSYVPIQAHDPVSQDVSLALAAQNHELQSGATLTA